MTATIAELKKALIENPNITDAELMDRFGVGSTLAVAAQAFIIAEREQTSEEDLKRLFPEFTPVKYRYNFLNWIVDALRSKWKLGRRGK